MNYRVLGKTGLKVSEIGFGAWGIGKGMWRGASDEESLKTLRTAVDLGLNFIDTALDYGDRFNHHSEKLIGQFLKSLPKNKEVFVASKIYPMNRRWPALPDVPIEQVFPESWIYDAVNLSLYNLGIESIDLMQFHVWQDYFVEADYWKEAVENLTREGKVKHWGISINDYQPTNCLKTLGTGLISSVQFIFNIFHQNPEEELLPYCRKNNIGLISRVPLDEGGLTGKITPETQFGDFRDDYFKGERKLEVIERAKKLQELMGGEAKDLPELSLRFLLTHPEVSTVIPGMRTVAHVTSNVAVSDGRFLSPGLMAELKNHVWERNFYDPNY